MSGTYSHFVGMDWSGAKGGRHAGLAVAICEADTGQIQLVAPPSGRRSWARQEIAEWVVSGMELPTDARALIGIDSAFSLPFLDYESFLPGEDVPESAVDLWQRLDHVCVEAQDLYGGPFVDAFSDHFLRTGARGTRFERRLRVTERLAIDSGAGPCESVFHLIGPSQVGMSGLSTMRLIERLRGHLSIWPFEVPDTEKSTLVEIYAAAFARLGGHRGKIRTAEHLARVLGELGGKPAQLDEKVSEHAADAMVTAAGLRAVANERKYWHPPALSTKVRRTEGWIFGIV